jgi:hypothetical protein
LFDAITAPADYVGEFGGGGASSAQRFNRVFRPTNRGAILSTRSIAFGQALPYANDISRFLSSTLSQVGTVARVDVGPWKKKQW